MKVCILCEEQYIDSAREQAKLIVKPNSLKIPVSETGELPATHYFCFMSVNQDGWNKLMSVQKYSIIEESDKDEFLNKYNLKIIK